MSDAFAPPPGHLGPLSTAAVRLEHIVSDPGQQVSAGDVRAWLRVAIAQSGEPQAPIGGSGAA